MLNNFHYKNDVYA